MIKHTSNVKESVNYLSTMTNMIRNKFQVNVLVYVKTIVFLLLLFVVID